MFTRYDENGKNLRRRTTISFKNETLMTEQAHAKEVNINNIVKRHGIDLIQKTSKLMSPEFQFDDISGNDFTEAMLKITKAQQTFDQLPSELRKQFNNAPGEFMDFVQNPDNMEQMVEMGLAQRPTIDPPIQVEVTNSTTPNPETPPE